MSAKDRRHIEKARASLASDATQRHFDVLDRLDSIEAKIENSPPAVNVAVIRPVSPGSAIASEAAVAIEDERVISFVYIDSKGERSTRIVSPWEIKLTKAGVRLIGYDHARQDIRQFCPAGIRSGLTVEDRYEYRPPEPQTGSDDPVRLEFRATRGWKPSIWADKYTKRADAERFIATRSPRNANKWRIVEVEA